MHLCVSMHQIFFHYAWHNIIIVEYVESLARILLLNKYWEKNSIECVRYTMEIIITINHEMVPRNQQFIYSYVASAICKLPLSAFNFMVKWTFDATITNFAYRMQLYHCNRINNYK